MIENIGMKLLGRFLRKLMCVKVIIYGVNIEK